ncbi:mediator of RNA polymerase II transcription subunit 15a-like protein [Perilla frutescens var. hirtella]|nr:mediator of RNA polymerase II transcription subunit 15a-like protein [Perilla frutescens var. hirtella]
MPGFNWREGQGQVRLPGQAIGGEAVADAATEGGDWRSQLPPGSRHRIVNKLLDILKKHLPFSEEEGLRDLEETAVRFEESIFTTATSQSDYLRKISLKLLGIETKSQKLRVNSLQTNATSTSRNSQDPGMEVSDWRDQLQSESRTRIVNKIVETLKRHLPFSGLDGALEVERIAVRFEEKIYTAATSQSDYLRKISLKMLTLETRSQNPTANSLQSNAASYSGNSEDPDDALLG